MTPSERMLRQFTFVEVDADTKTEVQNVRDVFRNLAVSITARLPESAEKTVCLRKLLEAKDCAVRAFLEPHFDKAAGS